MNSQTTNYRFPLAALTALFFMWGFITCLNDILIPYLKNSFQLNYLSAALIQSAFFFAYFVMSIPSGAIVTRWGYQKGIVIGLLTAALGAFLFFPAAAIPSFGFFLAALFILASGITLLQVAANPYVTLLGDPRTGSSRLNLTQAFNSLGTTLAPVIGGTLLLKGEAQAGASEVQTPYLILGSLLLALGAFFCFLKLPHPQEESGARQTKEMWKEALKKPSLVLGAVAIFTYVGAEVSIGSFLVSFIGLPHIMALPAREAALYVSYYWGGAMIGRFVGSALLQKVSTGKLLALASLVAALLIASASLSQGPVALYCLLLVGGCNSIMFPSIFALGIKDLGSLTGVGSSLLIMAIVGGAVIPLGFGGIADHFSLPLALWLPVACYLFITYYAISSLKKRA